jgi:hypothetical protein
VTANTTRTRNTKVPKPINLTVQGAGDFWLTPEVQRAEDRTAIRAAILREIQAGIPSPTKLARLREIEVVARLTATMTDEQRAQIVNRLDTPERPSDLAVSYWEVPRLARGTRTAPDYYRPGTSAHVRALADEMPARPKRRRRSAQMGLAA